MSDLSPRERRALKTHQSIVDAALDIIRREGVDNLSMRGIADAIDYSAGAIYKYFDNKEALLGEICTGGFERLAHNMQAKIDPAQPVTERLIAAGLEYIRFARDNPEVFRMMFDTVDAVPPGQADLLNDSAFSVLAGLVREAVESGAFAEKPGYDTMGITFHCWYVVHGIALLRLTMFAHEDDDFDRMNAAILRAHITNIQGE